MTKQYNDNEMKPNWAKPELIVLDNEHIRTSDMPGTETATAMGMTPDPS